MRIIVNGENISYSLENETNLLEVLRGLRDWLKPSGFIMTAAQADKRILDLGSNESLAGFLVSKIDELALTARPLAEMDFEDLQAIREFFRLTRAGIEAADPASVKEVLENYPAIRENIGRILERHGISGRTASPQRLDELFIASGLMQNGTIDGAERSALFELIDLLDVQLGVRMRELSDPRGELKRAAEDLSASVDELSEVSIMLQTGRDADAMQAIVRFTELSAKLVRLYPLLKFAGHVDFDSIHVNDLSFADFYGEFNGVLSDLIDAFAASDTVLIGDLLEYEIAPRLEKLRAYVHLLANG